MFESRVIENTLKPAPIRSSRPVTHPHFLVLGGWITGSTWQFPSEFDRFYLLLQNLIRPFNLFFLLIWSAQEGVSFLLGGAKRPLSRASYSVFLCLFLHLSSLGQIWSLEKPKEEGGRLEGKHQSRYGWDEKEGEDGWEKDLEKDHSASVKSGALLVVLSDPQLQENVKSHFCKSQSPILDELLA